MDDLFRFLLDPVKSVNLSGKVITSLKKEKGENRSDRPEFSMKLIFKFTFRP